MQQFKTRKPFKTLGDSVLIGSFEMQVENSKDYDGEIKLFEK